MTPVELFLLGLLVGHANFVLLIFAMRKLRELRGPDWHTHHSARGDDDE